MQQCGILSASAALGRPPLTLRSPKPRVTASKVSLDAPERGQERMGRRSPSSGWRWGYARSSVQQLSRHRSFVNHNSAARLRAQPPVHSLPQGVSLGFLSPLRRFAVCAQDPAYAQCALGRNVFGNAWARVALPGSNRRRC
jgi:hypothetical protein